MLRMLVTHLPTIRPSLTLVYQPVWLLINQHLELVSKLPLIDVVYVYMLLACCNIYMSIYVN